MIQKITIKPNTTLSEILFFNEIDLSKKVNLLFGGNGVGKTSLIMALLGRSYRKEFETSKTENRIMVYQYINSEQNAREIERNPMISYSDMFDPLLILAVLDMSVVFVIF